MNLYLAKPTKRRCAQLPDEVAETFYAEIREGRKADVCTGFIHPDTGAKVQIARLPVTEDDLLAFPFLYDATHVEVLSNGNRITAYRLQPSERIQRY